MKDAIEGLLRAKGSARPTTEVVDRAQPCCRAGERDPAFAGLPSGEVLHAAPTDRPGRVALPPYQ